MTSRVVTSEQERGLLVRFIETHKLPFTAEIVNGKRRSVAQNRLQRLWLNEIAEQLGDRTAEEMRAYCKLHFGVPILRAENELFREKYDRIIKPLDYETKLEIMAEPLDFPVTRLMTTEQKTRYLNEIHKHFSEQGVVLTDPEGIAE